MHPGRLGGPDAGAAGEGGVIEPSTFRLTRRVCGFLQLFPCRKMGSYRMTSSSRIPKGVHHAAYDPHSLNEMNGAVPKKKVLRSILDACSNP